MGRETGSAGSAGGAGEEPGRSPGMPGGPDSAGGEAAPGAGDGGRVVRDPRLAGFAQAGEWALCLPGPELAAVVAAVAGPQWRCPGAEPGEMVGVLRRLAAIESWAAAGRLGVMREMIRRDQVPGGAPVDGEDPDEDVPGTWSESLEHELALALGCTVRSAGAVAVLARDLGVRLPGIACLLAEGALTYAKARLISETFALLSDADAARAETWLIPQLLMPAADGTTGKTFGQVAALAARIACQVDPGLAERRRRDAVRERARVSVFREDSGAAGLSGRELPPDKALAAFANLDARAEEYKDSGAFGDPRADRLRATAFLDLLNGVPAWQRIASGQLIDEPDPPADADHGDTDPGGGLGDAGPGDAGPGDAGPGGPVGPDGGPEDPGGSGPGCGGPGSGPDGPGPGDPGGADPGGPVPDVPGQGDPGSGGPGACRDGGQGSGGGSGREPGGAGPEGCGCPCRECDGSCRPAEPGPSGDDEPPEDDGPGGDVGLGSPAAGGDLRAGNPDDASAGTGDPGCGSGGPGSGGPGGSGGVGDDRPGSCGDGRGDGSQRDDSGPDSHGCSRGERGCGCLPPGADSGRNRDGGPRGDGTSGSGDPGSARAGSGGRPGGREPQGNGSSEGHDPGPDGVRGPGLGGPSAGGPAAGGGKVAGGATGPGGSRTRLTDLVLPLATLLGLAGRPGESHGFGVLDPGLCRHLGALAAASPRTTLCLTVTGPDGTAIGHGCARPAGPAPARPRGTPRTGKAPGALETSGSPGPVGGLPPSASLPARVNLTVTADRLTAMLPGSPDLPGHDAANGPPGTRQAPGAPGSASPAGSTGWALAPPGTHAAAGPCGSPGSGGVSPGGAPGDPPWCGAWTLTVPGGARLTVRLEPVPADDCDHRHESHAYQPSDTLRHLVQVRDRQCTFPPCSRHARDSDFEHAVPYHQGGRTCACNAGARSRRCHRVKQQPDWQVTQPRPGWHQWRTPAGWTYTQAPYRYPV